MRALTPGRHSLLLPGLPDSRHTTSLDHSASNHPTSLQHRFRTSPQRVGSPDTTVAGPGFATRSQARRDVRPNRVRHYPADWSTHLLLLSTPPRGDAVAFGFRAETLLGDGLSPSLSCALTGARARASRPRQARATTRQKSQRSKAPEIGVGRTPFPASPLPPHRACGSPAHGVPVGGSPFYGLKDRAIGC